MAKAAEAFRTISEVADELELQKHVLRFWEVKFPQIKPMKRGGGRRYYRPADLDLLRGIRHLLHAEGYTIKGVQKILRERGVDVVKRVGADVVAGTAPAGGANSVSAPDDHAAAEPAPEVAAASSSRRSDAERGAKRSPSREAQASSRKPSANTPRDATPRARELAQLIAELETCRAILLGKAVESDIGKSTRAMRAAG